MAMMATVLGPKRLFALLSLVGLLAFPLGQARGEDNAARRAEDISNLTMSPFCPGRTLSSCPSPSAAEWRSDIRRWTEEGLSTEEIRARLEQRVPGEDLSGAPNSPGGWVLPIALGIASAWLLVAILRRLRRQSDPPAAEAKDAESNTAEADRRLDSEMERLDD